MGWFILSIVITIILFIVLSIDFDMEEFKVRARSTFALLGLLFAIPAFFTVVPANTVGIVYSPFDGLSEITLSEGIHTKQPLSKVYKIDTQVQSKTLEGITTQTSDSQFVTSILDIKYSVNPGNAFLVFKQFKTLDKVSESLISPTVQRTLEKITTEYNVIDILGTKRNEVYKRFEAEIATELAKSGVTFYSVTIQDTDAGSAIEDAIVQEAVAKKAVETAEQQLLKIETEAKQKTVQAEADKKAMLIQAEGQKSIAEIQAETTIIQAQAQADANNIISNSITATILKKLYLEKWDGKRSIVAGSGSDLMFDVQGLLENN